MDKYIGRLLDRRYEILELIGYGGMANVYRASDHRLGRMVAVKILKDDLSRDPEFRRRFHAESQAIAMMSHPNIVNVYDVSHSDEVDFIVMELIDGLTLKDYMQSKGTLNWRETLHFTTQIAKALEHAHGRGIVHRDIKPHNIMVLKDGSVKVADFGIARMSSSQNTLTREALGSVHYISPEQARGAAVDQRSDLYSLGVVMYEMLTGKPPYEGETPVSVAIQHLGGKLCRPTEKNPTIPAGLEQIILRLMEVNPDRRYPDAAALLEDLEKFRLNPSIIFGVQPAPNAQPEAVPARAEAAPKPRSESAQELQNAHRRNRRTALLAGGAAVIVVLLLLGWFLYSYLLRDLLNPGEEKTMPKFIGMQMEDLDERSYPDLTFEETWVYDNTAPAGQILDQDPAPQAGYKGDTTVRLTISSGIQTEQMPVLSGQAQLEAERQLKDLGLTLSILYEEIYDSNTVVGYVIRTEPAAGTTLRNGDTVKLYISLGQQEEKMSVVPNVVGETLETAQQLLEQADLKRGALDYQDSEEPEGTVLFQGISAGKEVAPKTEINLQVSRGPAEKPDETEPPPSSIPQPEQPPEEMEDPDAPADPDNPDAPAEPEPGTEPETPDTPPDTPTVPEGAKEIVIPLPEGEGMVEVVVRLDGELVTSFQADCADRQFTAYVNGNGQQLLTVFYNGMLSYSEMIDFDA